MRIAVIGAGSIGSRHLQSLRALDQWDVLIYDSRFEHTIERYGAEYPVAGSLADVWGWQPEAVLICTPPDSHAELARTAAYEGVKGIFIEKPLGLMPILDEWMRFLTSPDDCVTMVACQWRWHPAFTAMQQWAQGDTISRPAQFYATMAYDLSIRPDYRTCYAATTGATLDIGSHLVDLARWCFGAASLKQALVWPAERIGLTCDGAADIELNHECGITSHLSADFASGRFERSTAIVGADGEPDIKLLLNGTNKMYVQELAHFLACVREGRQTCNPIGSAAQTLNLLFEAKQWAK